MRGGGCAGDFLSYCLVAEGAVDIAAQPEVSVGDLAALDMLVREAVATAGAGAQRMQCHRTVDRGLRPTDRRPGAAGDRARLRHEHRRKRRTETVTGTVTSARW
jgi:hypothetical protein